MILFKNAKILTMEDDNVIENGYIIVDKELISYVGVEMPTGDFSEVIDCKKKVIMPSLSNTHSHIPMTLFRGYADDIPLHRWLNEKIFPIEDKLTESMVYNGTMLGIAEMIKGGITSYSDMYFFNDAIIKATIDSKIKGNIAKTLICFDEKGINDGGRYDEAKALYNTYNGAADGKIKVDLAFHAIYTCPEIYLKNIMQKLDYSPILQYHISETIKENVDAFDRYKRTPTKVFYDAGVFDIMGCAAHCVHLTEEDRTILSEKGIFIATNTSSNLKLGSGMADVAKMVESGINVTIGTDGAASNNNLNIFEEMHLTALLAKGLNKNPEALPAIDVLKMATKNGYLSQGRNDSGVIKVGNKADLIVIDFDVPHLTPNFDTVGNLVYSAQASDVYLTMCDGEILYINGEYKTIDIEKVKFEAEKSFDLLMK